MQDFHSGPSALCSQTTPVTRTAACAVTPARYVLTMKAVLTATSVSAKTPMRTRVVSVLVSVRVHDVCIGESVYVSV